MSDLHRCGFYLCLGKHSSVTNVGLKPSFNGPECVDREDNGTHINNDNGRTDYYMVP